jgi:hypothetical protein
MIEITDGFTSITIRADEVMPASWGMAGSSPHQRLARAATGARVTVEFCRDTPLPEGQAVRVRYDFADDGSVREGTGMAQSTRSVARWGATVVYHYRLSHWIAPAALTQSTTSNVRHRTEHLAGPPQYPPMRLSSQ